MTVNVLIGLSVMLVCLVMQATLVALLVKYYAYYQSRFKRLGFFNIIVLTSSVMLTLVIGNFIQVSIWALLFIYLGEFSTYSEAAYHSGVNFSTLGYGDIVMSEQHRILGPIQAINGVLMIGVTTAVVMTALQNSLLQVNAQKER